HPHRSRRVAIVHNGIVENYSQLLKLVEEGGREMASETDSEVIAHLIDMELDETGDPLEAVRRAVERLSGSFAFCAVFDDHPNLIVAARQASPMVIGLGRGANFIASDAYAISKYCKDFIFMDDGEIALITPDGVRLIDVGGNERRAEAQTVLFNRPQDESGQYRHHMQQEIFEQPEAVRRTIRGRISDDGTGVVLPELEGFELKPRCFHLAACGTAYHAALVARFWIERWTGIPCLCDHASEFRYRSPLITADDIFISISQSGETADTIGAQSLAKQRGARTLTVCNVPHSTLARTADAVVYTHAGTEIAVASTKAFTAQLAALILIALKAAQDNGMDDVPRRLKSLAQLPELIERALECDSRVFELARRFAYMNFYIFLGRQNLYPIALEGALKLKEISYHFAEAYPAGEMKHGPIALADKRTLVVGLLSDAPTYGKTLSNLHEIRSRGSRVIGITFEGDEQAKDVCDEVIALPRVPEDLAPILWVIPTQLFAYHIACELDRDVDKPRNLAKSVTVE
ncbi:MAG TPA: glutamine--fructose-6-phosphate transaminase (isomerizing), partial [Proteobacteria bacterium]|nr:glutamine--fructose-6-phosphate transaminase (isomerizing) [Pseudomonadota bacterium]